MRQKQLMYGAWSLAVATTVIAVLVWGQSFMWRFGGLSTYQIFPVLGLVAFGLMWGHYIVAAIRHYFHIERSAIDQYFRITSIVVLIAILMHPGLLIWQLLRDGLGLPPFSYERVYGWLTLLGTLSLCVFLAYELHRKFAEQHWWKYIERLNDAAMLAVFYHGLRLGTHTQTGWFHYLWYFYGCTLVVSLIYLYYKRLKPNPALPIS